MDFGGFDLLLRPNSNTSLLIEYLSQVNGHELGDSAVGTSKL